MYVFSVIVFLLSFSLVNLFCFTLIRKLFYVCFVLVICFFLQNLGCQKWCIASDIPRTYGKRVILYLLRVIKNVNVQLGWLLFIVFATFFVTIVFVVTFTVVVPSFFFFFFFNKDGELNHYLCWPWCFAQLIVIKPYRYYYHKAFIRLPACTIQPRSSLSCYRLFSIDDNAITPFQYP